ncbi:MAG: DEAD/DEAH box helicase [bacterium]|nr:DEAD/DEAH box helicase [bacterium]
MQLSDLERHRIPRRILDLWRQRQGERLLPVQRQAIQHGLLGDRQSDQRMPNLIVTAPTSSGKSFCAELAAARALMLRQKVVMLFPLKALAEEKYRQIGGCYRALGLSCLIVTGDHPENDRKFLDGDFHLAIAIYEKFDLLLATQLDTLRSIGLVVIDELQMLAEPFRGAMLERLLTKLRASSYRPTLLALSAVIGREASTELARWLDADLVCETARPVELMRGVAADGALRLRSYNSGEDQQLPFIRLEQGPEARTAFLKSLREDTGSTLVFMKSRRDTVDMALRLAATSHWPSATQALDALADEEPSYLVRSLKQALGRGVAFHNSDLSSDQRLAVERAFRRREVSVLFTTTTLALGINLPADTVYLETVKYTTGAYGGRPRLVPISRAEFDNITGRAGRLGCQTHRPARAIVLAESGFDGDILWDAYINNDTAEPFESAFQTLPLEDWLLHLVVAKLGESLEQLTHSLKQNFYFTRHPDARLELEPSLGHLHQRGLIDCADSGDHLWATSLGQAVVRAGLTVAEADHFLQQLDLNIPQSLFGWTALALSSSDWNLPPGILTRLEYRENLPVKMLYQRFDFGLDEVGFLLPENHRREPLDYRTAAALKAALLLDDWCRLASAQQIEERYQMHLGQVISLAENASHLVNGLTSLLEAREAGHPSIELLHGHAFSLRNGLPVEMKEINDQFGHLLKRPDFLALHKAGFTHLGDLLDADHADIQKLTLPGDRGTLFQEELTMLRQQSEIKGTMPGLGSVGTVPHQIEIDGTYEGDRYLVRINGFPVRLTGKSFKYLTKLAWSRVGRDSGWIFKEDLEAGFNQARYLYRLKSEIGAGYPSNWQVFENNRLGYYRLDIDPRSISINYQNLRHYPDFEVQQLCANPVAAMPGNSLPC